MHYRIHRLLAQQADHIRMDNPYAIGTTLQVKVSDADVSDPPLSSACSNFQIKGSLTLTAPNGGQVWIVGASQLITWTETGTTGMGNIDFSYSINGGADGWDNLSLPTPWPTMQGLIPGQFLMRFPAR